MNFSEEKMISVEEAKKALRCMQLSGLSLEEALETLDDCAFRIRNLTTSKIVERLIETELTEPQRRVIKMYFYDEMNTVQIGKALNISQASAYQTIERASNILVRLLTPLIEYQNDIAVTDEIPIKVNGLLKICAAQNSNAKDFATQLRNLRLAYDVSEERLAANLKISEHELAEIETGKRLPTVIAAMRYSALFDAEINMNFKNGKGVFLCRKP